MTTTAGKLLLVMNPATFLPGYARRRVITVDNSSNSSALTRYQVKIDLTSSNFDFTKTLSDGSDIRVTDSDGLTLIPYYILAYDQAGQTGTIWVKIASIPASSIKRIYLYYGNPTPATFDVPPVGPFQKSATAILATEGYLAENAVYDAVTNKYWLVYSDFNTNTVALAWSSDLSSWTDYASNPILTTGDAQLSPCLVKFGATWYLYYAKGANPDIYVATASAVTGPYTTDEAHPALTKGTAGAWDDDRILEPYVFLDDDGRYIMFYMGDAGSTVEQVGYATSLTPTGPFTKYVANPVIVFGAAGTYDAGTVADPAVYKFNGTYYIYYASSITANHPWQMALATSTDLVTFTKQNIVLGVGNTGAYDASNAHRGAVSRFGDTYYFPFTGYDDTGVGWKYKMGIATQAAKSTATGYPPQQVFDLYDDFSAVALLSQWSNFNANGSASLGSGVLTIASGAATVRDLVSAQQFPAAGVLLEIQSTHPNADGSGNHAGELGFSLRGATPFVNCLRTFDLNAATWFKNSIKASTSTQNNMAQNIDTSAHLHKIWRKSTSEADFAVDANAFEAISTNVPTVTLSAWLYAYSKAGQTNTNLLIDWVRVRQYSEPEPSAAVGNEVGR